MILSLHVQPRASRTELAGVIDGRLKLRLKGAPVDGKAYAEMIRFLSKLFGISKKDVSVLSGECGRLKRARLCNVEALPDWMVKLLQE